MFLLPSFLDSFLFVLFSVGMASRTWPGRAPACSPAPPSTSAGRTGPSRSGRRPAGTRARLAPESCAPIFGVLRALVSYRLLFLDKRAVGVGQIVKKGE